MALSKYQEVAKRILEFKEDDFKLDMDTFHSVCGTTFCLAGWLAHQDDYPGEYINSDGSFSYGTYSEGLIGYWALDYQWDFLFCPCWPDSLEYAKRRAKYVLDNDDCPEPKYWSSEWSYELD